MKMLNGVVDILRKRKVAGGHRLFCRCIVFFYTVVVVAVSSFGFVFNFVFNLRESAPNLLRSRHT